MPNEARQERQPPDANVTRTMYPTPPSSGRPSTSARHVDPQTDEGMAWSAPPVADKLWRSGRGDKGGFI